MLIYYFYLYYWFFDLDNFFILYFASDGTGSVPFVAGGEIGKFSQYQLNIYLFLLGLLLDNFNDKKFIFDLCSLVIFWTFVFALVKTFGGLFNNNSLKTLFGLTVVGALLTYAPFGHWFFVETATPSKLAEILFICSLIIFFSPVKKYKALFLIIVTLLACNTHASLVPTFVLFFCSYLITSSLYGQTDKNAQLLAICTIIASTFYGFFILYFYESSLHKDSFSLGKTWSDLWIDTPKGKALNAAKVFTSTVNTQLIISFFIGMVLSYRFEFKQIAVNLRLFYLSGLLAWFVFHFSLFLPPVPYHVASLITEVSLLRIITPISTLFPLVTLIIVTIFFLKITKKYCLWFLPPLLLIFVGVNTKNIYQYSKENSSGIETEDFQQMVNEINLCCQGSILVSHKNIAYTISPFVEQKVYAIMKNRMKFVIGWEAAHQAEEINRDFLQNPALNRNRISADKDLIILLDNNKLHPNIDYNKLSLIKQSERFTLFQMKSASSAYLE